MQVFFEKKSKIFEICVAVHSEGKNLSGQGMAFRYSSGDIPKVRRKMLAK